MTIGGMIGGGIFSVLGVTIDLAGHLAFAAFLLGAAVIFVAYEGFELLPYDYDDLAAPRRTLPRALYLSVAGVAVVYVAVTLASQMLLPDATIAAEKEVAFAVVGEKALGGFGLWAAAAGALLATSSAINATLFSTARLARDVSGAGELPAALGRERHQIPAAAIVWLALLGAMSPAIASSKLPSATTLPPWRATSRAERRE